MITKDDKKRILMLSSRWIYPLDAGYKMRIHYIAKILSKYFKVDLLCLGKVNTSVPEYSPFANVFSIPLSKLRIASNIFKYVFDGWPLQVAGYNDIRIKEFIEKNIQKYDMIYINHVRLAPLAFGLNKFSILDYHDAISMNYRESLKYARGFWKLFYKFESERLLRFEEKALSSFELCLITSEQDKNYLLENSTEDLKNKIEVIPMGIREEVVAYQHTNEEKPWVVMVGKMSYYPNYEGVLFFIKQVFPTLKDKYPDLELYVVGSDPPKSLREYDSLDGIHVTGFVEDPWYYVSRSLVVVAPIRIGAGIQNKVLEAMAIGKPVVATSRVMRGLNVAKENIHLLKADSAEQFADEISRLIDNPNLRMLIGKNGQLLVKKYFMWNNIETKLLNVISEALKWENYSENK